MKDRRKMSANPNNIFPRLPKGSSLPFYYASVNANFWKYLTAL